MKPWREGSHLRAVRVGDHYELREFGGVWSFDDLAERAALEQQADIDAHAEAAERAASETAHAARDRLPIAPTLPLA